MISKVKMQEKIQKDWNSKTSNTYPYILHVEADTDAGGGGGGIAIALLH